MAAQVLAENPDFAGARRNQAQHHLNRGGLAGAVGAEQTEDFPAPNRERDVVYGLKAAESLGQMFDLHQHQLAPAHFRPRDAGRCDFATQKTNRPRMPPDASVAARSVRALLTQPPSNLPRADSRCLAFLILVAMSRACSPLAV